MRNVILFLLITLFIYSPENSAVAEQHVTRSDGLFNRRNTEGVNSRQFPGILTYISVLGAMPSFSLEKASPGPGDSASQVSTWVEKVKDWKQDTSQIVSSLKRVSQNNSGKFEEKFRKGLVALSRNLSEKTKSVQIEEGEGGGASGGFVIVSDQARALSEEITSMIATYAEAMAVATGDSSQSQIQKMQFAHRAVKTKFSQRNLAKFTGGDLKELSLFHKSQVADLTRLRDSLYLNGNFSNLSKEYAAINTPRGGIGRRASTTFLKR